MNQRLYEILLSIKLSLSLFDQFLLFVQFKLSSVKFILLIIVSFVVNLKLVEQNHVVWFDESLKKYTQVSFITY